MAPKWRLIMNILEVAKNYTKNSGKMLIGKTVSSFARLQTTNKETLLKTLQTGSVIAAGMLLASKLFGLQVVLGLMGGTIMLADILEKVEDEEQRERIEKAFKTAKEKNVSAEDLMTEVLELTKK
jgi:hypothetical protein